MHGVIPDQDLSGLTLVGSDAPYRVLGAHEAEREGVAGFVFAVWAPNARRVSVVGDFNHWDGRAHVMRKHPASGVWEIFMPGMQAGTAYKYEIVGAEGRFLLKADPYARQMQLRPDTASIVPAPPPPVKKTLIVMADPAVRCRLSSANVP